MPRIFSHRFILNPTRACTGSKKEDELTVAKIEIFHLKHRPTNLKAVMASFNREFVHCRCVACFESKRCEAPSLSQMPAHTCYFAPTWESVLAKYSITFEHQTAGPSDDQLEDPIFGLKIDSPALLVQVTAGIYLFIVHSIAYHNRIRAPRSARTTCGAT